MTRRVACFFSSASMVFLMVVVLAFPAFVQAESFCSSYESGSTNSLNGNSCSATNTYAFNFAAKPSGGLCYQNTIEYCPVTSALISPKAGELKIYYKAPVSAKAMLTVGGRTYSKNVSGEGVWETGVSLDKGESFEFYLDHGETPFTGWTTPTGNICQGFTSDSLGQLNVSSLASSATQNGQTVISRQCWGDGMAFEEDGSNKRYAELILSSGNPTKVTCRLNSGNVKDCRQAMIEDFDFNDSAVFLAIADSVTPNPTPHISSCDKLDIISGNQSLIPAKLRFLAKASDNMGDIQQYRFLFGDGKEVETSSALVQHTYEVSGNFTARVAVQDSAGNWQSSDACTAAVTVKPSKIESHKSACSSVYIVAPHGARAPAEIKFNVSGYDNKGDLQAYKIDFGDGNHLEQTDNEFIKTYDHPGTYTIKAYIKDSHGNWQGGDNSCEKPLYIETQPLVRQPETGTPTIVSVLGVMSGLVSGGLWLNRDLWLKKRTLFRGL